MPTLVDFSCRLWRTDRDTLASILFLLQLRPTIRYWKELHIQPIWNKGMPMAIVQNKYWLVREQEVLIGSGEAGLWQDYSPSKDKEDLKTFSVCFLRTKNTRLKIKERSWQKFKSCILCPHLDLFTNIPFQTDLSCCRPFVQSRWRSILSTLTWHSPPPAQGGWHHLALRQSTAVINYGIPGIQDRWKTWNGASPPPFTREVYIFQMPFRGCPHLQSAA